MARPKRITEPRISTAVRLPAALHDRLAQAAEERDVSINYLVNRAVEDFIGRLIPPDEMEWVRSGSNDDG